MFFLNAEKLSIYIDQILVNSWKFTMMLLWREWVQFALIDSFTPSSSQLPAARRQSSWRIQLQESSKQPHFTACKSATQDRTLFLTTKWCQYKPIISIYLGIWCLISVSSPSTIQNLASFYHLEIWRSTKYLHFNPQPPYFCFFYFHILWWTDSPSPGSKLLLFLNGDKNLLYNRVVWNLNLFRARDMYKM